MFKKDEDLTEEERLVKKQQMNDLVFIVSCGFASSVACTLGIKIGRAHTNTAWRQAMNLCYEKSPELKELTEKVAREVADDLGI